MAQMESIFCYNKTVLIIWLYACFDVLYCSLSAGWLSCLHALACLFACLSVSLYCPICLSSAYMDRVAWNNTLITSDSLKSVLNIVWQHRILTATDRKRNCDKKTKSKRAEPTISMAISSAVASAVRCFFYVLYGIGNRYAVCMLIGGSVFSIPAAISPSF